jgi:putative membrane protein
MRRGCLVAGLSVLALAWAGGLPAPALHGFSGHMTVHMAVVAVAAPLLALAVAGSTWDPARVAPRWFAPIPASLVELVVVWGWHAPALHRAARAGGAALVLEQASFLVAGMLLWIAALGGSRGQRRRRVLVSLLALLLTSMHMTLLGALLALAPRPLYAHGPAAGGLPPLVDQQLGGAIMLLVGGVSYLAGGAFLAARALRAAPAPRRTALPVPAGVPR